MSISSENPPNFHDNASVDSIEDLQPIGDSKSYEYGALFPLTLNSKGTGESEKHKYKHDVDAEVEEYHRPSIVD